MSRNQKTENILSASGSEACDLLLRNARVVNVLSGEIHPADLAIRNGYFVGFGSTYQALTEIDLHGSYVCPSLFDAHIHIESTLATPAEFSRAAVKHGIGTVIMDPHEIANVLGLEGINIMLEASDNLPVDFYAMLSSSVPATRLETSGATLEAQDLVGLYRHPRVLGLAEVMDLEAVKSADEGMLNKLFDAQEHGRVIDGHGSGLSEMDNNVYRTAGISTDHECVSQSEALDRLRKGFYIHIREGSVAKNFEELIGLVTPDNYRRFTFCTDDIYINDLDQNGSIDTMVRRAITKGLTPLQAISLASINPAECYGLRHQGAVAPGYKADFLVLSDLESLDIKQVFKAGIEVFGENKLHFALNAASLPAFRNTVNIQRVALKDLEIELQSGANVIEIQKNSLLTLHKQVKLPTGLFQPDPALDLAKIFVIERHRRSGNIGKGIITGFNMKNGAVATTIAHDSHNIVVMGMNDEDILLAVRRLEETGGGIVIVRHGQILAELALDLAGLISTQSVEKISEDLSALFNQTQEVFEGLDFNPFLTLSFVTLPVIPELKITDQGLYSASAKGFIPVSESSGS